MNAGTLLGGVAGQLIATAEANGWLVLMLVAFGGAALWIKAKGGTRRGAPDWRPRTGTGSSGAVRTSSMDGLPLPRGAISGKPLLSEWERVTLRALRAELPAGFHACPQVRLVDMLSIQGSDRSEGRVTFNRLASKSVDFAVVDGSGRVAVVVELDDRTHGREDRIARDKTVSEALGQAGIPLARFKPGQRVDVSRWTATR